jgi:hypothetical protein
MECCCDALATFCVNQPLKTAARALERWQKAFTMNIAKSCVCSLLKPIQTIDLRDSDMTVGYERRGCHAGNCLIVFICFYWMNEDVFLMAQMMVL